MSLLEIALGFSTGCYVSTLIWIYLLRRPIQKAFVKFLEEIQKLNANTKAEIKTGAP